MDDVGAEQPGVIATPGHRRLTVAGADRPVGVHLWPAARPAPGDPLIMAFHGWTDGGAVFAPLAEALAGRYTVVAPDAPAHGGTPWHRADRYSVPEITGTALAVVDQLATIAPGAGRLVLIGHSMGALTAADVARSRPDRVCHLLLEEPLKLTDRASRSLSRWRATPDPRRWHAWLTNMQALDHEGRLAWVAAKERRWSAAEFGPWAVTKAEVDLDHLTVPVDYGPPLITILERVTAPITVLRGRWRKGGITSTAELRQCLQAHPVGMRVVKLDVGHNVRREAPEEFARIVAEVADGCRGASEPK